MLSDFIKFGVMTPLQEQTTALGICSYCHTKTLAVKLAHAEGDWMQCSTCLAVFFRDPFTCGAANQEEVE